MYRTGRRANEPQMRVGSVEATRGDATPTSGAGPRRTTWARDNGPHRQVVNVYRAVGGKLAVVGEGDSGGISWPPWARAHSARRLARRRPIDRIGFFIALSDGALEICSELVGLEGPNNKNNSQPADKNRAATIKIVAAG